MPCGCDEEYRDILPCDPEAPPLPDEGVFLIPLCVDKNAYQELIDALTIARDSLSQDDCRLISVENALAEFRLAASYVGNPTQSPCIDVEENCYTFPPSAAFIQYHPQNPYTEPGLVPPGYTFPPFYIADSLAASVYDAQIGAVVTSLERLPPASTDFPTIRVNLNGQGRVEFHMSALNTGGLLVIDIDDDPLQSSVVDLHQDIVGVPPETENIIVIEREITTPGAHFVDLTFIPTVQDAIPPVLFGGGLYKVVLCGFDTEDLEVPTILRQNEENPCHLEFSIDGGVSWGLAFDYSLCQPATSDPQILQQFQASQALSNQAQQALEDAYTGTPSSVNPSAPDDNFDGDASPERDSSLCSTAMAFVRWYAARKIQQVSITILGIMQALDAASVIIPGLGWALDAAGAIALGDADIPPGISPTDAILALNDTDALDDVACCIYSHLQGLATSSASFADALNECEFETGSNAEIARYMIAASLSDNYLAFLDMLGDSFNAATAGQDLLCSCQPVTGCFDTDSIEADLVSGNWVADPPNMRFVRASAMGNTARFDIVFPEPVTLVSWSAGFQTLTGTGFTQNNERVYLYLGEDLVYTLHDNEQPNDGGYVWQTYSGDGTGVPPFDRARFEHVHVAHIADVRGELCVGEAGATCEDCEPYTEETIGLGDDGTISNIPDDPRISSNTGNWQDTYITVNPSMGWDTITYNEPEPICINRIGIGLSQSSSTGLETISANVNGTDYPLTMEYPATPVTTPDRVVIYADIPPQLASAVVFTLGGGDFRAWSIRIFSCSTE